MRSMRTVCLLGVVVLAVAIPQGAQAESVKVTGSRLNIRSEPAVDGAVLAVVNRGDLLEVLRHDGDWYAVRVPGLSRTGFVHRSFVAPAADDDATMEAPRAEASPTPVESRARTMSRPSPRTSPRFAITGDYVLGIGTSSLAGSTSFSLYAEDTGRLTEDYSFDAASGFALGARALVFQSVGLEASYSVTKRDGTTALSLRIPHPLYLDEPRSLTPTTSAPTVKENAFHVGIVAAGDFGRFRAGAYGGPSFYSVTADMLSQVTFSQTYPYDAENVTVASAPLTELSKSTVGFHAGGFAEVVLHPNFGIGVDARFTRATVDLERPAPGDVSGPDDPTAPRPIQPNTGVLQLDVGSFQILGGLRLYF